MTAADPIVPDLPDLSVAPRLRLVEGLEHPGHPEQLGHTEHTWQLRSVDFSDGAAIREFGCATCSSVWFD